jgi:putative transposase
VSRGAVLGFITAERTSYGARRLRRVLGVSKTACYDWAGRGGSATLAELEEAYAIHAAHQAWGEHRRVYGARRLTAEIRSRGHDWNRKRVARLMRVAGIEGIHRRRRGKYGRRTGSTATAADLVERNFTAAAPDQL